jgi:glycosyltransferase involved in cell wall biosynthesis
VNLLMLSGDTSVVRGEQGAFYNTLSELSSHWDNIDILISHVPDVSSYKCFDNVNFYCSNYMKILQPFFIWKQGSALASIRNYDLIVSHDYGWFLNGMGAKWLVSNIEVPYISEIHHVDGYPRAANLRAKIQPWLTRFYIKQAIPHVLGFRITNSVELKSLLTKWGVSLDQILLLYSLYLDFDVFRPMSVPIEYDAIFVGRLTDNKAPHLFLDGVAKAADQKKDIRVLIVGQGPLFSRLRQRTVKLGLSGNVDFKDWISNSTELANYYRSSRCLVCTSYSEGGPRVVAEALACGTPIITTRVGLANELIKDGVNGFFIDWSADMLGNRLIQIISDTNLRDRMAGEAPKSVQKFEKTHVVNEYASYCKQLVSK